MEKHRVGQLHQVSTILVPIVGTYLWTDRQTWQNSYVFLQTSIKFNQNMIGLWALLRKTQWNHSLHTKLMNILCPTYKSDASWFNGDLVSIL